MQLNPDQPWVYRFMTAAFIGLNRFPEAREITRMGEKKNFNDHPALFRIAFLEADDHSMQRELDIIGKENQDNALLLKARRSAYYGRWKEALSFLQRRSDRNPGTAGGRLRLGIDVLTSKSLIGFCTPTDPEFVAASAPSRTMSAAIPLEVPFQIDGSLCGNAEQAEKLSTEIANRYPRSTVHKAFTLPQIRAAVHLHLNQPERALDALRPALKYEGGSGTTAGSSMPDYIVYLRGQAYSRLGRHDEAAAEFQKILDHSGWNGYLSSIYPMPYLGLARAHKAGGKGDASRKAYESFIGVWKDADPDLPVLVEAKKEFEGR
jgi:tetratricopeptide (TPR) repeat protein